MSITRPAQDGRGATAPGTAADTATGDGTAGVHRQDHGQDHGRAPGFRGDGHGGDHDAGTGELIKQATRQVSDLLRAELRLAVAELKDKGRHAGTGAGMFGGAALVALYGVGALIAAVIAAIAVALPVWASALIVGAALLLVAGVLAMLGRSQARRAAPAKPEQAMDEAKHAVAELKERATHR
ncbi:phage holin family protein [Actinomadura sp. GC306]|uniref:phage holin family protein n=1 Tax=Actinomadura sp. GC306 TaxID=2530367 RepID=UPI0010532BC6|nr:phage holin family protein [Actinomadura sp. GC306]TDC65471.1 phage holin family protein [Actinomadura sp. GC306]